LTGFTAGMPYSGDDTVRSRKSMSGRGWGGAGTTVQYFISYQNTFWSLEAYKNLKFWKILLTPLKSYLTFIRHNIFWNKLFMDEYLSKE
jgi:hypothetical protein